MHVLVTGGAGFIGSHLVDELVERGKVVTVIDDLSTGKISNLSVSSRVKLVVGDVGDPSAVRRVMRGVDQVVHLAAVASVQASVENPLQTNRTNLVGTINVLKEAAEAKVSKFLFASSAAVYGDQSLARGSALDERSPLAPTTPYAIDKLAGEQYLAFFHTTGQLEGSAFRFFNIFGPRQDPTSPYSGVISIFNERISRGLPVTVFGDGEQTRDFLFVGDLVKLLADGLEMRTPAHTTLPRVNLGSGVPTSLKQLIGHLASIYQVEPVVNFQPARTGDIKHSLADVTALKQLFGPRQFTPVKEALRALKALTGV